MPTKASDVAKQPKSNEETIQPSMTYLQQPWWHGISSNATSQGISVECNAKADAENEARYTLASGDELDKNGRQPEHQVNQAPMGMPPPAEEQHHSNSRSQMELAGHSVVMAPYPFQDPCYGGVMAPYASQVNPQLYAMHQRVPLPLPLEEEPVYVNAKQYHGIMRRRQSRARAELEKKAIKSRKPYLHESRHKHALRRPRGSGGRFLNTKKLHCDSAASTSGKNPTPDLTLPTPYPYNQQEPKGSSASRFHNTTLHLNNNNNNSSGWDLGTTYHSSSMSNENIDGYVQGGMKVNGTPGGAVSCK